jgi:transcriptional regulator with XRE-family HTH domain
MKTQTDYSEKIKAMRLQRGITTQQLAERCGVSRRTVEGWEQGRTPSNTALTILRRWLAQK